MQWLRGSRVEVQRQQLGPCVMADRVHHAFAFGDQRKVEVGDDQPFAVAQRLAQMLAFG